MEEIRDVAIAYYKNGSRDFQQLIRKLFKSMDANGDGTVSLSEFIYFLRQQGYGWVRCDLFSDFDLDGDGNLDFGEFLASYYMAKVSRPFCDGCGTTLTGLYFTCVTCFDRGDNTFDLCATCHSGRKIRHRHNCFLDNYVLLMSKKGPSPENMILLPSPSPCYAPREKNSCGEAFEALENATANGTNGAAANCSIM